eukprot:GFUD01003021.1.p1 GENE.GFUD01003021.1~~GFUD01003021.1.p1  ORF type:complete len:285 (-),score=43.39 GFUD01003021.1:161-1015(-)
MASSDIVNIPPGTLAYVSYYIILPLVMFVHAQVVCVMSCMENTVTSITPVVQVGVNSVKAKMKEFGITSLSEEVMKKIESNVFSVTAAADKLSSLARCVTGVTTGVATGVTQLAVAWKIPSLRTPTTALIIETVQDKATSYGVSTIGYMASFSLAQVVLKVADAGLHVLGQSLWITGVSDRAWRRISRFHLTTSTIPLWSNIMARADIARKKKEVSTFGIVVDVLKEFLSLIVLKMIQLLALMLWMMELWWRWLVMRRIEIAVTCQFALNAVLLLEKFVLVQHK